MILKIVNGKRGFRGQVLSQYFKNRTLYYFIIILLDAEGTPVCSMQDKECVENSRRT